MLNSVLDKALDVVQLIEDGKLAISGKSPGIELWANLRSFQFPDYLELANKVGYADQAFDREQEKALRIAKKLKKEPETITNDCNESVFSCTEVLKPAANYIQRVKDAVGKLKYVSPTKKAPSIHKKTNDYVFWNTIAIFWEIPALFKYAPHLTLLAFVLGLPKKFTEKGYVNSENYDNIEEICNDANKGNIKDTCKLLRIIFNDWKKRDDNHRENRYKSDLPYYNDETLEQDFWIMIVFMQMQKELATIVINNQECGLTDSDLSAIYKSFLEIWPYSPQLFFEDTSLKTASDWESALVPFLTWSEQRLAFWKSQVQSATLVTVYPQSLVCDPGIISLSDRRSLWASSLKESNNWLIPHTPYFSAYYFIDDFRLYGIRHYKKWKEYKEIIVKIKIEEYNKIMMPDIFSQIDIDKLMPKTDPLEESVPDELDVWSDNITIEEHTPKKDKGRKSESAKNSDPTGQKNTLNTKLPKATGPRESTIKAYFHKQYWAMMLGLFNCIICRDPLTAESIYNIRHVKKTNKENLPSHKTQDASSK